jgi:hypothetical protein
MTNWLTGSVAQVATYKTTLETLYATPIRGVARGVADRTPATYTTGAPGWTTSVLRAPYVAGALSCLAVPASGMQFLGTSGLPASATATKNLDSTLKAVIGPQNVVFDGNSLVSGEASTGAGGQTLPQKMAARTPVLTYGGVCPNLGGSGQTWRQMSGLVGAYTAADVDNAYTPGRENILVCWETTNSIATGRTVSEAVADCTEYIAARKAKRAWSAVILLTALPRSIIDPSLRSWNTYALANYLAMGADYIVDVRQSGSPFNFAGEVDANFVAVQPLFYETSSPWTHLTDAGYVYVANYLATTLAGLL